MQRDSEIYGIQDEATKFQRIYKNIMLTFFVLIVGGGVVLGLFHHVEDIITVSDDAISFAPKGIEIKTIPIEDIKSLELIGKFNYAEEGENIRIDGCTYGEGFNDKIGKFVYYFYDRINLYIVLKTDCQTIVFNYINKNNTSGFYEALKQMIDEH